MTEPTDGPTPEPTDSAEPTLPLAGTDDHGDAAGAGTPPRRSGRRVVVIATVAVLVAAVLGAGAWAALKLSGGGPQPAEALPASTLGVVSVDLDPSAGQKIAAIRTLRKFPDLKKRVDIHTSDDVREYVFDRAIRGSGCTDLDFDDDVAPWLGDRAAVGAVDLGGDEPTPVAALQVADVDKARAAIRRIVSCADAGDLGVVVDGDYAILSDTTDHARQVVAAAKKHPLSEDKSYRTWNDEVGDRGVVSFYVAKRAAELGLDRLADRLPSQLGSLRDALDRFEGLAGTVRFHDGVEVETAVGGLEGLSGTRKVGDEVGRLPADTALALGMGVPDDYASKLAHQVAREDSGAADMLSQIETQTGLELPDDLQTLLGEALVFALGGDAPESLRSIGGLSDVPAAIEVKGDTDKIEGLLDRVQDRAGIKLALLGVSTTAKDGRLALATDSDFAAKVLAGGHLADDDAYRKAVPEADRAAAIGFVRVDSAWRTAVVDLVRSLGGTDEAAVVDRNSAPLEALGISSWRDGEVSHVLAKLTTR